MGGKSGGDQVTGYQYYANLVVMIGNRIEELKAINFDKRGWILNDEQITDPRAKMLFDATYSFTQPGIYGKDEGGVAGSLGLRIGNASPVPDSKYAEYLQSKAFPALSYPYLSYLVFKGRKPAPKFGLLKSSSPVSESGFYFGNNPFLKEMMLWVKRIHVRNDGCMQWHDLRAAIGSARHASDVSTRIPVFSGNLYLDREVKANYNGLSERKSNDLILYSGQSGGFGSNGILASVGWSNLSENSYQYGPNTVTLTINKKPEIGGFLVIEYELERMATSFIAGWGSSTMVIEDILIDRYYKPAEHSTEDYYVEIRRAVIDIQESENIQYSITVEGGGPHAKLDGYLHQHGRFSARPGSSLFQENASLIDGIDINPIHKIREILTDDTAMNISELEINEDIFMRAADQIWDEGLGISAVFTEKNCKQALDEICAHIEAGIRVNRQTGKYEVILFRDNWQDSQNALHFDKTNIKRGSFSVEVMNTDDAINVLNVNYYDRANIKNSSFNVYENGLIQTMGHENAETVDFPYFMNQRNAEVVANWKLKQLSTPAWRGSFATSARAARKLNRYDIVRVTWPSKQIYNILIRVMKINLGTATDTSVTVDFVEVVSYSNNLNSSIVVDAPVSGVLPPQTANPIAFEVPYYALVQLLGQREADAQLEYNSELSYLGVATEKPQNNSLNALLYTDGGTGDYLQFQKVGVVDYSSGVYLDQQILQVDTSFAVIDLDYVQNGAPKFSGVAVGTIGQLNSELISFVSYDLVTKILTVKRGVLDTLPTKHIAGNINFWGEAFAYDSTEYSIGETVEAQVLTTTPSGVDVLNPGSVKSVKMNARAIRPYPPANVKINNIYYPEALIVSSDIVLTWVNRNRLQQTGGQTLGFYDAGVTIESGVTYSYELISENIVLDSQVNIAANTVIIPASVLIQNKPHTLQLWSVRDGYSSYQAFEHSFFVEAISLILTAVASKDKVVGSTVPSANILVNVDESLKANMKFDGSGISGKADAGAIITIEVQE